jgi:hypothetical protein
MSFAARPRSGMAGVKVRLIDHLKVPRRERSFELLAYPFRNRSRCSIHFDQPRRAMRHRHAQNRKYAPRLAGVHISTIMNS